MKNTFINLNNENTYWTIWHNDRIKLKQSRRGTVVLWWWIGVFGSQWLWCAAVVEPSPRCCANVHQRQGTMWWVLWVIECEMRVVVAGSYWLSMVVGMAVAAGCSYGQREENEGGVAIGFLVWVWVVSILGKKFVGWVLGIFWAKG